ncbi:MAG: glycosyltransferase family 9 protein [Candidatus Poribacteria bacterium]|nr:glycosyltransferase family 9 protein [Candidatus Poribacteria bacterium]
MNANPQAQIDLEHIQRILILRMGPLGETILTTPVIRALRIRFPNAHIAYMVAPAREQLVSANPYLDEVITYDICVPKLVYGIMKRAFQMAVVLQPTFRLVLHIFLARIPFRVGFETNCCSGRLLHVAVPNNTAQHETNRYLDVVRGIGIQPDSGEPEMFVDDCAQRWAGGFLAKFRIDSNHPLIGLNPGTGSVSRRWQKERFAEIGNLLHRDYNAQIIITGGPREGSLPYELADMMGCSPIVLTGTTPMQLGAVIQRCRLFISNDTGPMHMSTAVKTPTIALFGSSDPSRWGPFWNRHTIIARNSMDEIAVNDVLLAAEKHLSTADR